MKRYWLFAGDNGYDRGSGMEDFIGSFDTIDAALGAYRSADFGDEWVKLIHAEYGHILDTEQATIYLIQGYDQFDPADFFSEACIEKLMIEKLPV